MGHWHCYCSVKTRYLGVMGNARMTDSGQKSVTLLNNIVNYVKFFLYNIVYIINNLNIIFTNVNNNINNIVYNFYYALLQC